MSAPIFDFEEVRTGGVLEKARAMFSLVRKAEAWMRGLNAVHAMRESLKQELEASRVACRTLPTRENMERVLNAGARIRDYEEFLPSAIFQSHDALVAALKRHLGEWKAPCDSLVAEIKATVEPLLEAARAADRQAAESLGVDPEKIETARTRDLAALLAECRPGWGTATSLACRLLGEEQAMRTTVNF